MKINPVNKVFNQPGIDNMSAVSEYSRLLSTADTAKQPPMIKTAKTKEISIGVSKTFQ